MPSSSFDRIQAYRFGDCELRPHTRQLLRVGRPVPIQPKPFALLLHLLRHRDRVVGHAELRGALWPGLCVQARSLGFVLHAARKAVGDDGTRQAVIRTEPGVGLRFVAPVEEVESAAAVGGVALPRAAFLGRTRLLAEGRRLLEEAALGRGGVLLVSGEAGIGKTRALEALAGLAEAEGFDVLSGRCVESEGAPAFWPWVQILRAAVGAGELVDVPGEGAREVAWLVPELGREGASLPGAPALEARTARFLLFDSVATLLRERALQRPCFLCIDDLHRADTASVQLFRHVARELCGWRLVLVASYREAELRAEPALAEAVAGVGALPHARYEPLRGLEVAEVGALVQGLSGHVPSRAVTVDLHAKTSGNPFFVDQIVRVLAQEERLAALEAERAPELALPRHVQQAICQQLRRVPEATRVLIELAAVIGRDFGVAELGAGAELEGREVLARLGPALEAGIVCELAGEPGRFRFAHVLVRDAIYAGLEALARARWHGRVGRAIEGLGGSVESRAAELAHHFTRSGTGEDRGRAIHYERCAARWASERAAVEEAPRHLERALRLLDEQPGADERLRCELLIEYGDALTQNAQRDAARAALLEAARLAKQGDHPEMLAQAALRYAPDFLAIDMGVVDWDLVRLLEEALGRLRGRRSSIRARLQVRLALALDWSRGSEERIRSLCADAEEDARHSSDEATIVYVQTVTQLATFRLDRPEDRLQLPRSLVEGEEGMNLVRRILRITSLMQLGRFDSVDDEIDAFGVMATRLRQPQAMWYEPLLRATRALMTGDYAGWQRHAREYLERGNRIQDHNAVHSYGLQAMMAAVDYGDLRPCADQIRDLVARVPRYEAWRVALAFICCELGRWEEARRHLDEAIDCGALASPRRREWFGTASGLALIARRLGVCSTANRIYEQLSGFSGQFAIVGYGSFCWGAIDRSLANAAAASRRTDAALHHFEEAIRRNESSGARPALARCYFELAQFLEEMGVNGWAAARKEALSLSRDLGMTRLEVQVLHGTGPSLEAQARASSSHD